MLEESERADGSSSGSICLGDLLLSTKRGWHALVVDLTSVEGFWGERWWILYSRDDGTVSLVTMQDSFIKCNFELLQRREQR